MREGSFEESAEKPGRTEPDLRSEKFDAGRDPKASLEKIERSIAEGELFHLNDREGKFFRGGPDLKAFDPNARRGEEADRTDRDRNSQDFGRLRFHKLADVGLLDSVLDEGVTDAESNRPR